MSISSIAAQLYTVGGGSRRKMPLKTAFSMMTKEDLAMRFSVYNLVRTLTKSEFLASVAQSSFGKRTPLQKLQDKEERKREESQERFKRFTAISIGNLNRRVDLLTGITERNTALISNIYSELGAGRTQRRMNINNFNPKAVRLPLRTRTVRGQLDIINSQIQQMRDADLRQGAASPRSRPGRRTPQTQQDKSSLFNGFLSFMLRNPAMLVLLGTAAGRAVGLGTLAAASYSLYNTPGAIDRIITRISGDTPYSDPITEQTSQAVDSGIVAGGAFFGTELALGAARGIRNFRRRNTQPSSKAEARRQMKGTMQTRFMQRGMDNRSASTKARSRSVRFSRYSAQLMKFKKISGVLKFIGRRLPGAAAAIIAYEVSNMANHTSDRASGVIDQSEYKNRMVGSYDNIVTTVGPTAMGAAVGGLVGTAIFPGVATTMLATGGAAIGFLSSLMMEEGNQWMATKIFELLHEDKPIRPRSYEEEVYDIKEQTPPGGIKPPTQSRPTPINRDDTSNVAPKESDVVMSPPTTRNEVMSPPTTRDGVMTQYGQEVIIGNEIRKGGTVSWRTNNPGNIAYSGLAKEYGAIGRWMNPNGDRQQRTTGIAIMPSYEHGLRLRMAQWRRPLYQNDTIDQGVSRWTKGLPNVNLGTAYAKSMARAAGVSVDFPIKNLTDSQLRLTLRSQEEGEGFRKGQVLVLNRPETNPTRLAQSPETNSTTSTPRVSLPPDAPPLASNTSEMEQTKVNAVAALGTVSVVNQKVHMLAKETDRRIQTIEKLNPHENPMARNTGFAYKINQA